MADSYYKKQALQHEHGGEGGGRLSISKVLALVAVFPAGGLLLLLSAIILTGTVIGIVIATPLLVICSPVLVPAVVTVGLAVGGFLTSGALGMAALSSISWLLKHLRAQLKLLFAQDDDVDYTTSGSTHPATLEQDTFAHNRKMLL